MIVQGGVAGPEYDCFIVGTGPAGLTLALELAGKGNRVFLFESGGIETPRTALSNSVGYGHYGGQYWNRHWIRKLGGTSTAWQGWCAPLNEIDFSNPAVGQSWPITRADLADYYQQSTAYIDRGPEIIDHGKAFVPGFEHKPFSVPASSPTRFGETYRDKLESSTSLDVGIDCSVSGFEANDERDRITAIKYFHHPSGAHHRIKIAARQKVVIAAGGIGNAQLLLQPHQRGGGPIGNESGLAGKYIMEHPHCYGAAECLLDTDLEPFKPEIAFGAYRHALAMSDSAMLELGTYGASLELVPGSGHDDLRQRLAALHGRKFYPYKINVRAEMKPNADNHVYLTGENDQAGLYRPAVRCTIGASDYNNIENTLREFADVLIETGRGRLKLDNDAIYRRASGGGHIMGTTKMGRDIRISVVDANCKVHGYRNFFAAGSSVFPTGGYANPTLTIIALAIRLADYISRN